VPPPPSELYILPLFRKKKLYILPAQVDELDGWDEDTVFWIVVHIL